MENRTKAEQERLCTAPGNAAGQEESRLFQTLLRRTIAIYRFSNTRGSLYYSPRIQDYLGYSPEQLLANPMLWHDSIHPDDLPVVEHAIAEALDGKDFDIEYRIRDAFDSWCWMHDRNISATVEGSEVIVEGVVEDITRQKLTEMSLRKLSAAVEQSPVSILITDLEGKIEYVNPRFSELTGYSADEAIGHKPSFLIKEGTNHADYQGLWETVLSGKSWEGEFHNRKKDGTLFREHAVIAPIFNGNGKITNLLGIKEDITERRSLENQLRHAQKMESIGRLAGGIAHDFNNKLTIILGYSELLRMKAPEGSSEREYLAQIIRAAEHSRDITAQLLAFSRQQIVSPRPIDVNRMIAEAKKSMSLLIGEDIIFLFNPGENVWNISIDPVQFDQIIMNLAVNARDAMPDGGTFSIETRNMTLDRVFCESTAEARPGEYVQISFSDSGSGMSSEVMAHIFEPFYTTKEKGKGTGLGLATIYGIVTQNNGFIKVYSEAGLGSVFRIFLPRYRRDSKPYNAEEHAAPICSGTVLVVEDEEDVRKMTMLMLESAGLTVHAFGSPQEALRMFRENPGQYDLVISDVIMPGMNGKEMIRQMEEIKPGIRSLLMSGYTSEHIAHKGVLEDAMHFIQKPFDVRALNEKVIRILKS